MIYIQAVGIGWHVLKNRARVQKTLSGPAAQGALRSFCRIAFDRIGAHDCTYLALMFGFNVLR